MSRRYLTAQQARAVYDRIGRIQDAQAVYERHAVAELLARGNFKHAHAVFELGYGTGALAARLLDRYLPAGSRYVGLDVSPRMHALARRRLHAHLSRAELYLSDGSLRFPFEDGCFDRFLATYVLDLLSDEDIALTLREARRLLSPGGYLCLVSLSFGERRASQVMTRLWLSLWSRRPELVGGCRPIRLLEHVGSDAWMIRDRVLVTTVGISSEVLVAAAK